LSSPATPSPQIAAPAITHSRRTGQPPAAPPVQGDRVELPPPPRHPPHCRSLSGEPPQPPPPPSLSLAVSRRAGEENPPIPIRFG
jgi:hypothetical protein